MIVKMGYQGLALLLAAVVGIGFAAYQYYTQNSSSQSYGNQNGSHSYAYAPPPPQDSSASDRRKRKRLMPASDECTICYETLSRNIKNLRCGHSFHMACIETWFLESRTCPVCRCNA